MNGISKVNPVTPDPGPGHDEHFQSTMFQDLCVVLLDEFVGSILPIDLPVLEQIIFTKLQYIKNTLFQHIVSVAKVFVVTVA